MPRVIQLCMFVLLTTYASARGLSDTIQSLVESSDIVVIGRFHVEPHNNSDAHFFVEIAVDSILKGNSIQRQLMARVDVDSNRPELATFSIEGAGLRVFFLKNSGEHLGFTNSFYKSLPAVSIAASQDISGTDQVIMVECEVIRSASQSLDDRVEAIWSLDKMSSPCIMPSLREAAGQPDEALRLTSISELIKRGDTNKLNEGIELGLDSSDRVPSYLRENMASAIRDGVDDPKALPSLYRLIESRYPAFHQAALIAISRIGTTDAVPALVAALHDSDKLVRYYAVTGLAKQFPNGPDSPSLGQFYEDEQKYVAPWILWSKARDRR
jgi:hypothetical protein